MATKRFFNRTPDGRINRSHITPVAVGSIADKPHANNREAARRLRQQEKSK